MGFNPASPSSMERSAFRAVQDARAALRYLVHYADHFQIDTSEIYIGGTSAGAITALNLAYMDKNQIFESSDGAWWRFQQDLGSLDGNTNSLKEKFSIKAAINMWGAVHDTSIIDKNDQIPLISFHGDRDRIVPIQHNYPFMDLDTSYTQYILNKLYGSMTVHEQLSKFGIENELHVFEDKDHEPQLGKDTYFDQKVIDFIDEETKIFLWDQLVPEVEIMKSAQKENFYLCIHDQHYPGAKFYWKIHNGVILDQNCDHNNIQVLWFDGESKGSIDLKMITAVGARAETVLHEKL
ncbi:MAG: alpha/beta hydrolase fold domain-containing protein [Bacteroidales bacterium]|nr:alpha/beta hydrolase fold domain-containing protein [Bacteroidales bacterium]